MRVLCMDEAAAVSGGSIVRLIDWIGRVQTAREVFNAMSTAISPPGGPSYVTDPSSIGARNGSDAMSDNHETFGGGMVRGGVSITGASLDGGLLKPRDYNNYSLG